MSDIIRTLAEHAARYPLMLPTDAVKLLFQSEFGGGHLIADSDSCRKYLLDEYAAVAHDAEAPRYERICGGFVRVNLAALDAEELEQLLDSFIASSNSHAGDESRFLAALDELCTRFDEIGFLFTKEELAAYIDMYIEAGIRPVSHSERYREAYHPSYRVVKEEYLSK